MKWRGQPTALFVGILLHGLDAAQFCHHGAGFVSNCYSDPHCWRLGQQDGVHTAADCKRRCSEYPGCAYFTLHRATEGFHCDLLGPNARFEPRLPRAISGPVSCELRETPITCLTSSGYSDPFANKTAFTDLESCKGACDESASCEFFSFNQYLRTCYFLDENALYYPWLIGVISGRRGCELPASQIACKTDFAYTEPGSLPLPRGSGVDSPDACQRACLKDPRCKYFTFHVYYMGCWLLGGNVTLLPLGGTISGKRDCNISNICTYRKGYYIGSKVISVPRNPTRGFMAAQECRRACQEEKDCKYFNFQYELGTCGLHTKGASFFESIYPYMSGEQDCHLPSNAGKFCMEDGAYIDTLRDLSAPNGPQDGNPLSCQQACKSMPSCRFFTFSNASRQCWLLEHAYLSPGLHGYWSGHKNCSLLDPRRCLLDKGYTHPGTVLPNFGAKSPTSCSRACKRDPACRFFTFNMLHRNCWLLGQDAVLMPSLPGVVSGPPDCVRTAEQSKFLLDFIPTMRYFYPDVGKMLEMNVQERLAIDCPDGEFNFWGQSTCSACPTGSTRRRGGATRCIPCERGTYKNPASKDDCVDNDVLIQTEAIAGNMSMVMILRDAGTDMQLALRTAAWHNHTRAVGVLIKAAGADGMLTFQAAVKNATDCSVNPARECHREFRLMDDLWDANKHNGSTEGTDLQALVDYALRMQSVKVLQKMVAYHFVPTQRPKLKDMDDMPIFFTARNNSKSMSKVVLDAGESVEWKNMQGLTPIDTALLHGHDELASYLQLHARGLKEALADPRTHICVGISFALSVAFWFVEVLCSYCCRSSVAGKEAGGSSSDEDASIAARRLSEEDGYLEKAVGREVKASRGAALTAAKACIPTSKHMAAVIMRILAVLANLVFPGTFCARYVTWQVWLSVVVLLYILPAIAMHGCRTICNKPALVLSFTDFNFLGMHRTHRNGFLFGLLSLLRAVMILPLAIFLGGPQYHNVYAIAAERAPFMLGTWYRFCQWLELHVPCAQLHLQNSDVNNLTDLISFNHWYPAGQVHTFPLKLKLLSFFEYEMGFDMYLAIICWFAVLGFLTYLWCLLTLALLCNSQLRRQGLSKDVQASVHQLALEIEQTHNASELAELGPENEDLPKEVREVMRSNVKLVSALSTYVGAAQMLLDVALDVNTVLTFLISSEFFSAGVLVWFFFGSLLFELWEGSLFHLCTDSHEAVRRGFPVVRQLNMQDRERGFEALGSLVVMTASLLGAMKTPWQFLTGTLSLLSSTYGIASYITEQMELPQDSSGELEEETELEEGTGCSSD